ncbi:FtsW/RodA/SpoVE family cell cycle protein [Elusimicrobiota bacterium]
MRKKIDNIILMCALILGIWGIIMVISTTFNTAAYSGLYVKQILAFIIGFLLLFIMKNFSYKILEELSPVIYLITIFLLLYVLVFGAKIHGSKRWIDLGFFHLQPVEFAKIAVILLLAHFFEKRANIVTGMLAVGLVMGLVLVQPDAGSALIFIPVFLGMLAISRYNTSWMVVVLPFAIITGGTLLLESYMGIKSDTLLNIKYLLFPAGLSLLIALVFREIKKIKRYVRIAYLIGILAILWISLAAGIVGSNILRDYQKKRIVSFIVPEIDPLGAGYNTRQSILAVGSGKIFGKGLFAGTQTQLGFLPVKHNDFIFAAVSEEMGFAGAMIMLFILGLLLWQNLNILDRIEDYGGRLVACGIFILIFSQTVLNVGVVLGMMPVVGIQLPLVSYGGTGMVTVLVMLGILMNINKRTEIIGQ